MILAYLRSSAFINVPKIFWGFSVFCLKISLNFFERLKVKEIVTEQQCDWIVMGISLLAVLASLAWGAYQSRQLSGQAKKANWANAILFAFAGPAIWGFWGVYNSIENYYGLDSVKALEINFGIVIGIAVVFSAIHWLISRFIPAAEPKRRNS